MRASVQGPTSFPLQLEANRLHIAMLEALGCYRYPLGMRPTARPGSLLIFKGPLGAFLRERRSSFLPEVEGDALVSLVWLRHLFMHASPWHRRREAGGTGPDPQLMGTLLPARPSSIARSWGNRRATRGLAGEQSPTSAARYLLSG